MRLLLELFLGGISAESSRLYLAARRFEIDKLIERVAWMNKANVIDRFTLDLAKSFSRNNSAFSNSIFHEQIFGTAHYFMISLSNNMLLWSLWFVSLYLHRVEYR